MILRSLFGFVTALCLTGAVPSHLDAQVPDSAQAAQLEEEMSSLGEQVRSLNREVDGLQSDIEGKADIGFILFLYGIFCALWAQNTGRGPWRWFFLGLFFSVVTVLFLLSKNSQDRKMATS